MKILLPILVLIAGAGSATMVAMNSRLKDGVHSPTLAVAIAFGIGSILLFIASRFGLLGRGDISQIAQVPWWALCGGILSVIAVTIMTVAKDQSSTGFVVAASLLGQNLMATAIDHFGWMGAEKQPINGWKIAGIVLMLLGALAIGKK